MRLWFSARRRLIPRRKATNKCKVRFWLGYGSLYMHHLLFDISLYLYYLELFIASSPQRGSSIELSSLSFTISNLILNLSSPYRSRSSTSVKSGVDISLTVTCTDSELVLNISRLSSSSHSLFASRYLLGYLLPYTWLGLSDSRRTRHYSKTNRAEHLSNSWGYLLSDGSQPRIHQNHHSLKSFLSSSRLSPLRLILLLDMPERSELELRAINDTHTNF